MARVPGQDEDDDDPVPSPSIAGDLDEDAEGEEIGVESGPHEVEDDEDDIDFIDDPEGGSTTVEERNIEARGTYSQAPAAAQVQGPLQQLMH